MSADKPARPESTLLQLVHTRRGRWVDWARLIAERVSGFFRKKSWIKVETYPINFLSLIPNHGVTARYTNFAYTFVRQNIFGAFSYLGMAHANACLETVSTDPSKFCAVILNLPSQVISLLRHA